MNVLIFIETKPDGSIKKSSLEALAYAQKGFSDSNYTAIGFDLSEEVTSKIFGVSKIINLKIGKPLYSVKSNALAEMIASKTDFDVFILSQTSLVTGLSPFIAEKTDSALITNIIELPSNTSPIQVKRGAFSSKGIMEVKSNAPKTIFTITQNILDFTPSEGNSAEIISEEIFLEEKNILEVSLEEKSSEKIDLKEAVSVVSAGRGLKGPENWGMIDDLAELLGAATACSKPVSDLGWRPHEEHVGQTGKTISPNLYIAIGISGAIQHLAGISSSKKIIVINTDPEAPFFKIADYGIVGDAFEVVPKLIESFKA